MIPGKDGVVRLVKLKTEKGEILRPVQRLYPLEISAEEESQPEPAEVGSSGDSGREEEEGTCEENGEVKREEPRYFTRYQAHKKNSRAPRN